MNVLGVIINFFFPGIGTMVVGKIGTGIVQLVLYGVGWLFVLTGVGIIIGGPICLVVWIWSMVSAGTAQQKPQVVYVEREKR